MAKGIYIGVGNVAKKVKSAYIGVDGVARKIKKAYIGVGGVAKEIYSAEVTEVISTQSTTCRFKTIFTSDEKIKNVKISVVGEVTVDNYYRVPINIEQTGLGSIKIPVIDEYSNNYVTSITVEIGSVISGSSKYVYVNIFPTSSNGTITYSLTYTP